MAEAETDDELPVSWSIRNDEGLLTGEQPQDGAGSSTQQMFAPRGIAPDDARRDGGHATTG